MTYHEKTAHDILHLLTLCPNEVTELHAIIEKHVGDSSDWNELGAAVWSKHKEALEDRLSEADWWQAVSDVCMGAYHHSKGDLFAAIRGYQSAIPLFESQGLHYCRAVALMALARAYQSSRAPAEALRFYRQARDLVQETRNRCTMPLRRCKWRACRNLSQAIDSRMHEIEEPHKIHFIPVVSYQGVTAGEPLYMPGDSGDEASDRVILETIEYQLLSVGTRELVATSFSPDDRYCCVVVTGDSMIDACIHHGDTLLVKAGADLGSGQIGVFAEGDSGPMVKRFVPGNDRVFLHSANPNYPPFVYDEHTPELRVIGLVVGILEQIA